MTGESLVSSGGKGRSRIVGSPATPFKAVAKPEPEPKAEKKPEPPNRYVVVKATRTIGYSLQPGQSAKYRHRDNRELVTVTRFGSRQRWEDRTGDSGKSEYNKETKVSEYPHIWVTASDCEVKPAYLPAFLYPVMALDIAYEPEPEKVEEAA